MTEKKILIAAKLTVYRGEREEYNTFVTPECHNALEQYKRSRELIGEKITLKSPLIRDSWDNHKYRKDKRKEPTLARPLAPKTIANMMGEFLKKNQPTRSQFWHTRIQTDPRISQVFQD